MSKTRKLLAATLAVLALAAIPSAGIAVAGGAVVPHGQCSGGGGGC